ncbi:hypothetical protein Tco_1304473 [Tanacetum coccineum]
MAAVNDVPQLVDKKGGSYAAIAPKLEPGKFNKWKKQMLCYLAGMEPYYLKCIKDGLFQPKKLMVMLSLRFNGLQIREGWLFNTNALKASLCHVYQMTYCNQSLAVFQLKKHGLTWFTALKVP